MKRIDRYANRLYKHSTTWLNLWHIQPRKPSKQRRTIDSSLLRFSISHVLISTQPDWNSRPFPFSKKHHKDNAFLALLTATLLLTVPSLGRWLVAELSAPRGRDTSPQFANLSCEPVHSAKLVSEDYGLSLGFAESLRYQHDHHRIRHPAHADAIFF